MIRFGFAQISAQKRGRGEQQRQFVFLDQRRVLGRFERIWISDDADAFDERIPKRDGRSETVKERERRENGVVLSGIEQHVELRNVAENVAMTEHDSFRFAGAAAGEKQHCFLVSAFLRNF